MGTAYSSNIDDKEDTADHAEKTEDLLMVANSPVRPSPHKYQPHLAPTADTHGSKSTVNGEVPRDRREIGNGAMDYDTVDALDAIIDRRVEAASSAKRQKQHHELYRRTHDYDVQFERGSSWPNGFKAGSESNQDFASLLDSYQRTRAATLNREGALSFGWRYEQEATQKEVKVNAIIQRLRHIDAQKTFRGTRMGFGGQDHPRFPGDHFLYNKDLIDKTELLRLAHLMPKGAHLHIHFNACLHPAVLVDIAKDMDRMFITSSIPLTTDNDCLAYNKCEIQFHITAVGKERPGNLFDKEYKAWQTMKFQDFIREFPKHYKRCSVDRWLIEKVEFQEEEAHDWLQTVDGAWAKFNGRTRMMKGLFNYERAYRQYTRKCLEHFVHDNIQWAEIRPNFMSTNQLWTDDGETQIDNEGILRIIKEEYEAFQERSHGYFGGLRVIYCTPRSFSNKQVQDSLEECLRFKLSKEFASLIVGYDLVGEESKGRPLKAFVKEFLWFRRQCQEKNVEIPFLFHCGETLDMGNETDGNLVDALLLNSKRIGHGFALARHPYIMEKMKKQGICLEVCPISNEVLGLTPRINGHAMYNLLANDVHCTVNSDNGTLFKSTLSHDFYQVMVGKSDMTLWGWKQLVQWSLQHACMSQQELQLVSAKWEELWDDFLERVLRDYGETNLQELEREIRELDEAEEASEAARAL
ncbi:Adenosine deaminase CECR1-A 1 [Pleurostoma richardsiae]|uniref:adenosine deaminase n=1 Tax=Pleurostoma richardsiae TaxID=41990 RepID=A0AA38VUA2_9PEZI|nr:Adenosine deaminase CECR1-A 1 [Pleurostoma richardsiae]